MIADRFQVAGEEVVYTCDKKPHELGIVTRNYSFANDDNEEVDRSGLLSSKMSLNVSVIRKIGSHSPNASPWFPKKVVVLTDKRRIETMAWAHSSGKLFCEAPYADLIQQTKVSNDSSTIDDLDIAPCTSSQDSDPSLSSINASSWYTSHSSSVPPSDSTEPFQMSAINIEGEIDDNSLCRPGQSLPSGDQADNEKVRYWMATFKKCHCVSTPYSNIL
ncbi:unnamed protein product [Strongylus vulgaris]|uniref:Uncharacterized protein n=1 Tax=Strongylus vulgaris TaxID=40348 RepID=A0A3P7LJE9_STRVU|nr:unnamed protein product [Strongylus vulgaris]